MIKNQSGLKILLLCLFLCNKYIFIINRVVRSTYRLHVCRYKAFGVNLYSRIRENLLKVQCRQSIDYIFKVDTSRVLLYRDNIDRVLFYIKMTLIMSYSPHKGLNLVCQMILTSQFDIK